jgi:hypothetical protein
MATKDSKASLSYYPSDSSLDLSSGEEEQTTINLIITDLSTSFTKRGVNKIMADDRKIVGELNKINKQNDAFTYYYTLAGNLIIKCKYKNDSLSLLSTKNKHFEGATIKSLTEGYNKTSRKIIIQNISKEFLEEYPDKMNELGITKVEERYYKGSISNSVIATCTDENVASKLIETSVLFNYKVYKAIEIKTQRSRTMQCYNCQAFGHSSKTCLKNTSESICKYCAENHPSEECSEKKEYLTNKKVMKCANCSGEHSSNSEECVFKQKYIERINNKKKNENKKTTESTSSNKPNSTHGTISYSTATSSSSTDPLNLILAKLQNMSADMQTFRNESKENFAQINQKTDKIENEVKQMNNEVNKMKKEITNIKNSTLTMEETLSLFTALSSQDAKPVINKFQEDIIAKRLRDSKQ